MPATNSPSRATARLALLGAVLAALVAFPGVASAGSTTWLDPVRLDVDQDVSFEVAAANDAGAAVAIWQDYQGEGIRAAYRPAGGTWGTTEVPEPGPTRFDHEAVAVDAQGIVTLVYSRCNTCGMLARRRALDGTWSGAAVLDDLGPADGNGQRPYRSANAPRVEAGPDGRVTAVWVSTASWGTSIQETVRTSTFAGGSWSPVQDVAGALHPETPYVYDTRQAHLAVDEDGRAIIASLLQTTDQTNAADEVDPWSMTVAARPAGALAFGAEVQVAARTETSRPGMPSVAMADGVATLAWEDETNADDSYRTELRAQRFDLETSTFGAVADVDGGTVPQGHRHRDVVLDVSPAGDATLAWTYVDEASSTVVPNDVLVRTWRANGTWDTVSPAGSGAGERAYDVAAGPEGTVAVSWHRPQRNDPRATVRLRRPDGTWNDAKELGGPDAQRSHFPFVAVEADGDALTIWRSQRVDGNTATDFVEAMSTGEPPADTAGPQVTIAAPAIGQRFTKGADVTADYACTDETKLTLCQGNVADGAKLDTSTVGQHSFTVLAKDAAGHETTRTHGYFVDAPATDGTKVPDDTTPGGAGQQQGGAGQQQVVIRPPTQYHELTPQNRPTASPPPTAAELAAEARARIGDPLGQSIRQAPKVVSGPALAKKGVTLPVKPPLPNMDVWGGLAGILNQNNAGILNQNNAGILNQNNAGLIGQAAGNLIGPAAGNLIGPAAGNLISDNGLGLYVGARAASPGRVRATAAATRRLTVLAKGTRFFAQPKAGSVRIKLTKKGRAAVRRTFRKRGRQKIKLVYVLVMSQRGSGLPGVYDARTITVRE